MLAWSKIIAGQTTWDGILGWFSHNLMKREATNNMWEKTVWEVIYIYKELNGSYLFDTTKSKESKSCLIQMVR